MAWSFDDARSLAIDFDAILDGLELDEEIKNLAKGLLAFEGTARTLIEGGLSFTLGIGLEYVKATKKILPFIKGTTGLELSFAAGAVAKFQATVGPLSAEIDAELELDNLGEQVVIKFGLDSLLNYYLGDQTRTSTKSPTQTNTVIDRSSRRLQTTTPKPKSKSPIKPKDITSRAGFTVINSLSDLKNSVAVSIAGGLSGKIDVRVTNLPCPASASFELSLADINCVIQKKPGCISVVYQSDFCEIPSLLELLTSDPDAVLDAVDDLMLSVENLVFGRRGVIKNFAVPIIGRNLQDSIPNMIAPARRNVIGTLDDKLNSYEDDGQNTATVADIIANVLTELLGSDGADILKEDKDIFVTYYKHEELIDENGNPTKKFTISSNSTNYNSEEKDEVKSLMW